MALLTTTQRDYGAKHQALPKAWNAEVAAGGVGCARCGLENVPGVPWDLGHVDGDRANYAGPEHRRCKPGLRMGVASGATTRGCGRGVSEQRWADWQVTSGRDACCRFFEGTIPPPRGLGSGGKQDNESLG
jgi:hypothetical protein